VRARADEFKPSWRSLATRVKSQSNSQTQQRLYRLVAVIERGGYDELCAAGQTDAAEVDRRQGYPRSRKRAADLAVPAA
jgi:hypothetical protein